MLVLSSNVIDGGPWPNTKNPPYGTTIIHGAAILHKLAMTVGKISAHCLVVVLLLTTIVCH